MELGGIGKKPWILYPYFCHHNPDLLRIRYRYKDERMGSTPRRSGMLELFFLEFGGVRIYE